MLFRRRIFPLERDAQRSTRVRKQHQVQQGLESKPEVRAQGGNVLLLELTSALSAGDETER